MAKRLIARKLVLVFFLITFLFSSTGCGVVLYPERQGQKSGDIDLGVAFLDGVGLLIWVIPGVVAFAIDFYQGTIYLPNSQAANGQGESPFREVKIKGELSREAVEAALEQVGLSINLNDERAVVQRLKVLDHQVFPALAYYSSGKVL